MTLKRFLQPTIAMLFCITAAHAADTLETHLSLLPERLGPIESVMWSDHGAMRKMFDFPLTPEGREKEMGLRRTLLTAHQIGGFATLASMIATVAVGQMVYNGNESLGDVKSTLGWTTVTMYFTTASLALFTPPPMIRRGEWNTVSTHKLLGGIHFTGMILTPLLATMIEDQKGGGSHTIKTVHMISGYTTTVAFAAAMMVVTF